MEINDSTPVFYQTGKAGIIDYGIVRNGVLTGAYSNETLEQMRVRYPDAILGELGPVAAASEDMFRSPPVEIDEDRWMEMLEVLPPVNWVCDSEGESFKLSERTSGNITAIFARIGERYFEMQDSAFMKHEQIIAKCAYIAA